MQARFESFGGILSLDTPASLVYVDKDYMKNLGFSESPLWTNESKILSAPTEVHFSITNKCPMECTNCYVGAKRHSKGDEMSIKQIKFTWSIS